MKYMYNFNGKIFNNNTFINPFKLIKYIFNEKYKLNEIKFKIIKLMFKS